MREVIVLMELQWVMKVVNVMLLYNVVAFLVISKGS